MTASLSESRFSFQTGFQSKQDFRQSWAQRRMQPYPPCPISKTTSSENRHSRFC
ncbi:hypothetical protein NEIMUCOT_04767 [Neisseria mucosa ATCC 25996]|uniref:Uncharacterized protein n=1 Tax=Neisseria mucosa (strain ATCC 25996 / DSM 4631 / NCTC 10774 / M26) TaxID=546266 RepID=D2ZVX4_NEIM2|nr:hypothetical protein NEIMUCOT_04767 [Neisseria mucosa ATCC 25996]